jgi:hypothetical protein
MHHGRAPYHAELTAADIVTLACEALTFHRPDLRTRWQDYTAGTRGLLLRGVVDPLLDVDGEAGPVDRRRSSSLVGR